MADRVLPIHPVQLRNVRIVELEVHPDPEVDFVPPQLQVRMTIGIGGGIEPRSNRPNLVLRLHLEKDDKAEHAFPWKINCIWVAELDVKEGMSDTDVKRFSDTNGLHLLWPYAREFIADLTWRLGGSPPLTLPTVATGVNQENPEDNKQ